MAGWRTNKVQLPGSTPDAAAVSTPQPGNPVRPLFQYRRSSVHLDRLAGLAIVDEHRSRVVGYRLGHSVTGGIMAACIRSTMPVSPGTNSKVALKFALVFRPNSSEA